MNTLSEQVIARLNALVVVLDEKGLAEYVSPTSLPLLGFKPEDLLGEGWLQLTRGSEEERAYMLAHLRALCEGKTEILPYERRLKTAFGGTKWILWNSCKSADGKVIGIGYDISERKRNEEKLQQRTSDLDERNKEMESSLRYAQRIQEAILPSAGELKKSFRDAFVFYKPKDIVSGDLWWRYETQDFLFVAAIDCTGHGVPGALMSVIANSIFREVFINRGLAEPSKILYALDEELQFALNKECNGQPNHDGMDVALCRFSKEKNEVVFAGAHRPLVLVREGEIFEHPGSRFPLGFYRDVKKSFESVTIEWCEGDALYIFSDGYADQFGGERNKKLNKAKFRELLRTISAMNADEQESFLDYALRNWKQDESQTDDILVIGMMV